MWRLAGAAVLVLTSCAPGQQDAQQQNGGAAAVEAPAAPAPVAREPRPEPTAPPLTPPAAPANSVPPAKAPEPGYRAIGTEPFWAARLVDGLLTVERPEEPPAQFPVTRSEKGSRIQLSGEGIEVTIEPGPCSDGMSDYSYADHVQLALAGAVLKGCGGARTLSQGSPP